MTWTNLMSVPAIILAVIIFPAAAFGWIAMGLAAREAWKSWKQRGQNGRPGSCPEQVEVEPLGDLRLAAAVTALARQRHIRMAETDEAACFFCAIFRPLAGFDAVSCFANPPQMIPPPIRICPPEQRRRNLAFPGSSLPVAAFLWMTG
jgi:hypothetical protein